jgi:hypothetical protein
MRKFDYRGGEFDYRIGHIDCRIGHIDYRICHIDCRFGHIDYRICHIDCRNGHIDYIVSSLIYVSGFGVAFCLVLGVLALSTHIEASRTLITPDLLRQVGKLAK